MSNTTAKESTTKQPSTFGMTKVQKQEAEVVAAARSRRKDAPDVTVGKSKVSERKVIARHYVPESAPIMGECTAIVEGKSFTYQGVKSQGKWHTLYSSDNEAECRSLLRKGYERVFDEYGHQVNAGKDILWKIPTEFIDADRKGYEHESRERLKHATSVSVDNNIEETSDSEGSAFE